MVRISQLARTAGLTLALAAIPVAGAVSPGRPQPHRRGTCTSRRTPRPATRSSCTTAPRTGRSRLTRPWRPAASGTRRPASASQGALAITDDGSTCSPSTPGATMCRCSTSRRTGSASPTLHPWATVRSASTVHGSIVYVVNQGSDTIQGLRIAGDNLVPISHRPGRSRGPVWPPREVAFSPDGRILAVTEKATQTIDTYLVGPNGRASGPDVQASSAPRRSGSSSAPTDGCTSPRRPRARHRRTTWPPMGPCR